MTARPLRLSALAFSACLFALALPGLASAETLREALLKAYQSNPTLTAARAGQRATDENVPIQKSAGRPDLSGTGRFTRILDQTISSPLFGAPDRVLDLGATLNVPIYSGGAVRNGIRAAKARVQAGQADLRGTESSVFSAVVSAYLDVIRDSAIVSLNRQNVDVLVVNLRATNDRFEVGDLTRTDIAQSQSRLALARADLQQAEANLIASKERYIQLVGSPPVDLQPPPELPNLPASPEQAVEIALAENPDILSAKQAVDAARYDVRAAEAEKRPTVSAFGSATATDYLGSIGNSGIPGISINDRTHNIGVGLAATVPFYQGGRPAARTRQAQARQSQAMELSVSAERDVVAQVRSFYASWQASLEVITSSQSAIDATSLSLEGVRAENSVGSRTILDILDAEREFLNARVTLVSARRNAYVAGFNLLAAMGRGEAKDLSLDGGALYDPVVNYDRVKNRLSDWDRDPTPVTIATPTIDTPAQNANVPKGAAN